MSRDLKNVLDEMEEMGIFNGEFDAKNGSKAFMYGVWCVMDYLTSLVSEEYCANYMNKFNKNYLKSIDKI